MAEFVEVVRRRVSDLAKFLNHARLGFPKSFFRGSGGIGDDLMCSTVFHELRRRGARGIAVTTQYPGLFQQNPDVDNIITPWGRPRIDRWLQKGLPFVRLGYAEYDPDTDRDEPLTEHALARLCRQVGMQGRIGIRPYLFLTPKEKMAGCLGRAQIAIQSSGRSAAFFMSNKEWYAERFQEVCHALRATCTLVQIGSNADPALEGALDLRGKTTLRECAAILANSTAFIGQVGFLMHLARAVDCRSVIVYGGRESPWQTGYTANINLVGETPCSPCWLRNRCDYEHACMKMIASDDVVDAARQQIGKMNEALEVESTEL